MFSCDRGTGRFNSMSSLASSLKEVVACLQRKQSPRMAQIFSISYDANAPPKITENEHAIVALCRGHLIGANAAFADVASSLFQAQRLVQENKFALAYDELIAGFVYVCTIFKQLSSHDDRI
jgi:hypothetical protein